MLLAMSRRFEELDFQDTPIGEISLRRRLDPMLKVDVYEVKLGEEFLMSSLFTVAEEALATLGLAQVDSTDLDVVVGGLGLAYTAGKALADPRVRSVHVVEYLAPVIDWHQRHLLPLSPQIADAPRCHFVHGDFFALTANGFYSTEGLQRLKKLLHPGGVFALWSDDPPAEDFLDVLRTVFAEVTGHLVPFANPLTDGTSTNGVYVAR